MDLENSSNSELINDENMMKNNQNKIEENINNGNQNSKKEDNKIKKGKCIDDYLNFKYNEEIKEINNANNKDYFENIIKKLP